MSSESKIGRNDPCPCGSGEKYKSCHLGVTEDPEVTQKSRMALLVAVLVNFVISVGVAATLEPSSGVVVFVFGLMVIVGYSVLHKPPPSNSNAGRSDGINFGN